MITVTTQIDNPEIEKLLTAVQREFPEKGLTDLGLLLKRAAQLVDGALIMDVTVSSELSGSLPNELFLQYPSPSETISPSSPREEASL